MTADPYTATCRICTQTKACCLFAPSELLRSHPVCRECRRDANVKYRYTENYVPAVPWGEEAATEGGRKRKK